MEREPSTIAHIDELDAVRNGNDHGVLVELRGFEPLTPSLRKMWSKSSDQEERHSLVVLWGSCGASHARLSETR